MGLPATSCQQDVVLLPSVTTRHSGSVVGLTTVPQQQPPPLMLLQAYANYAMGPSQVGFCFRVGPPTILYIICLVSVFYFQVPYWMLYSPMELNHWGLHHCIPLGLTHGMYICNLVMVIDPHQVCTEWVLPPLF